LRGEFVRHGLLIFGSTTFVNLLNAVFYFVIARRISVSDYGALTALTAGMVVISLPAVIAALVIARYAAEFHALEEYGKLRSLLEQTSVAAFGLGVVIFLLVWMLHVPIESFLRFNNTPCVLIAACALGLGLVTPALRAVLQGVQEFRGFAISIICEGAAKVGGGVLLAQHFGVTGAMSGFAIGGLIGIGAALVSANPLFGYGRSAFHLDPRRLAQTMAGVGLSGLCLTALLSVDVLLVKHYFEPRQAGIYGLVSQIGKVLVFVAAFIPTLLLPKATAAVATGKSPRAVLFQAAAASLSLTVVALCMLFFFSRFIVQFIGGPNFARAAPYFFPYGVAMAVLAGTQLAVTYKIALHRFHFVFPLVAAVILEVAGIVFMHETLWRVIAIVILGNVASFLAVTVRFSPRELRAEFVRSQEVAASPR